MNDIQTKSLPENCSYCGSNNLKKINVTGYTDLECGDCGQTLVDDIYNEGQWESDHATEEPVADAERFEIETTNFGAYMLYDKGRLIATLSEDELYALHAVAGRFICEECGKVGPTYILEATGRRYCASCLYC